MKFLAVLFLLIPALSHAEAAEKLKRFVSESHTLKARFSQSVYNGKKTQKSAGEMMFSRPGKFRWIYEKPYPQLIVGDGAKLWVYDSDLNQVTVRKLDQSIGNSPAALLAGENEIEKLFTLKEGGQKEGIEWLEATPKTKESSFESVRMGFSEKGLAVMELKDYFGQTTLIHFFEMEKNPRFSAEVFKFRPPAGADVIGE